MIIHILSASPSIASDLIERTASTPGVVAAVASSLTPAFLLVGIGSIMNVVMSRLIWLAGRIERLSDTGERACDGGHSGELEWLCKRRRSARLAIKFSTGAAVVISLVIAMLFLSAFVEAQIGTVVAVLWVATIFLLITGLAYFLHETLLAADGPQDQS